MSISSIIRKCPVCNVEMIKRNVMQTEVDQCGEHGLWLDKSELEKLLAKGKGKSSRYVDEKIKRAKNDGKRDGIIWGMWSLFMK